MKNISRVLVANRGEIAVRIIKACRELGIESVAAVSEADKGSLPARIADRVVCIGPAPPKDSYLKIDAILTAALGTGADAVHPGYGFLAECPELAEACQEYGLTFIGPPAENIRQMGNKLQAREIAERYGIPIVPGSEKVRTLDEAIDVAKRVGFPVLLKSAAGGGGRGMRIVTHAGDIKTSFEAASAEARAAFNDDTIYIERYIPNARHIEVQIAADQHGNVIHIGERDCSLQRRYQKIIEEAPAVSLPVDLRANIRSAGVKIARSIGYENLGTVEFIVDQGSGDFYFLEMNTRIQVEHPVTEMISGLNLVEEQIRIAAGYPLSVTQSDVQFQGHAIECRVTAESPEDGFRPCPGRVTRWAPPQGPGIRVDSHCETGYFIPPYYDSLLAKVITWGTDRAEAVKRMKHALQDFHVSGVSTVIPFLQLLISQPDFERGSVNTRWVENMLAATERRWLTS